MKQYSSCNKKAFAVLNSITAILSIHPVFAVDYVACREMLRTKNEMISIAREKEEKYNPYLRCPAYVKELEKEKVYTKEAREIANNPWGYIKGVQKENINWDYPFNYSPDVEQNEKPKPNENKSIKNENSKTSAMSAIMLDCLSKTKNYETSIGSFYSKEAMSFAKGAEKVIKDMKRAGCPYQ
jgi:hypothetical protein